MDYTETLDWLFQQFPSYQIKGAEAYKPDLRNISRLCKLLKIEVDSLKYIHVAGTNGKGSTCSMLASILTETGEKVGLFTSPHISDFRERIRVNGEMISELEVISFCDHIKSISLDFKPSFFEITWALTLSHFIKNECSICLIETGLGGRLDSTNIITPILSIITNVGLDHIAILGSTLTEIAHEKAGIIKNNVPVLIGERQVDLEDVFRQKASTCNSEIHFSTDLIKDSIKLQNDVFYLRKNEITVRAAVKLLNSTNSFIILDNQIEKGIRNVFKNTGLIGRFTTIQEKPRIILDVAHNEDGFRELIKALEGIKFSQLHVILGMSSDKDLSSSLNLLPDNTKLYFCEFSNPRSMKKDQLQQKFQSLPYTSKFYFSISEILPFLQNTVNKDDVILVAGSFFLLSDFFTFFQLKSL